MKKTLALILCLAMLFTALSVNVFAETKPSVEVITHSASAKNEVDFAIKLANFTSLKGFDLVIEADAGVTFTGVSALNTKNPLNVNENYTIKDNVLHIVELTTIDTGDIITVTATLNSTASDHTITVTACELAKNGDALYIADTEYTFKKEGTITSYVAPKTPEVVTEYKTPDEGYFIPYGSAYKGDASNPDYVPKEQDGTFKISGDTTVTQFKIPADGFGTYGVSDSLKENAKQFGNYVETVVSNKDYGSIVIAGDWEIFRDWYLSNKGYSDADLVKILYNRYLEKKGQNDTRDYIPFGLTIGEKTYVIKVFNVKQYNYLWKNADSLEAATSLEYGVRVKGLQSGSDYATIAYYADKNDASNAVFAKEIRTVSHN